MSATGDELFSKLTDIVRELKDAKDASDKRIDDTEETLKGVKDTLAESTRYDKETSTSFKKLLEATKEHTKLLKGLKPEGLTGTSKDKGSSLLPSLTTKNLLRAGIGYEAYRTLVQRRGATQNYGPLAGLMAGGGAYAAGGGMAGLGAIGGMLGTGLGYGALGYGGYRLGKGYLMARNAAGVTRLARGYGAVKAGVKAMPATARGAVAAVSRTGAAGAAAKTAGLGLKGYTGVKDIGGTMYKLKNGSITHIHGGGGADHWIKKGNKKAFAKAVAVASRTGAGGAAMWAGAGGLTATKAIPVIGWLIAAGMSVTEAYSLLSDQGLAAVFEEEWKEAGMLGKVGKTLMNPVKAVDLASKRIIEWWKGYEDQSALDKKWMKVRERPTVRTRRTRSGEDVETSASKEARAEFKKYEQYHKTRNKLITDIVGTGKPGSGLDDGMHYLWGMKGFATGSGRGNAMRYFNKLELQSLNITQLQALKGFLVEHSTAKTAQTRRGRMKDERDSREEAEKESFAYSTAPNETPRSFLNEANQRFWSTKDYDIRALQERRLDELVMAGKITDENFKYLKPHTQKYLKENYDFNIPELTEAEKRWKSTDLQGFNQYQQEQRTANQNRIAEKLGLAAEAFHKFIKFIEEDPSTISGVLDAKGKSSVNETNVQIIQPPSHDMNNNAQNYNGPNSAANQNRTGTGGFR